MNGTLLCCKFRLLTIAHVGLIRHYLEQTNGHTGHCQIPGTAGLLELEGYPKTWREKIGEYDLRARNARRGRDGANDRASYHQESPTTLLTPP